MSDENNQNNEQNNNSNEVDYVKLYESDEKFKAFIEEKIQPVAKKNKELLEKFAPLQKKLKEDSLLQALADGKHDEVFSKIKEERDSEWKELFSTKETELSTTKQELEKYKSKLTESALKDEFLKSVEKTTLKKIAFKDAIKELSSDFSIDENGVIKHKQNKLNKAGKQYEINDWLEEQQTERSYWFEGKSGSGSTNSQQINYSSEKLSDEEIAKLSVADYKIARKNDFKRPVK